MEVGRQRRHGGGGQMKRMKTFAGRGVLFKNRGCHSCCGKEPFVFMLALPKTKTECNEQGGIHILEWIASWTCHVIIDHKWIIFSESGSLQYLVCTHTVWIHHAVCIGGGSSHAAKNKLNTVTDTAVSLPLGC